MRGAMSVVVLISGRGSNLDAMFSAGVPVAGVISNRPEAGGRSQSFYVIRLTVLPVVTAHHQAR